MVISLNTFVLALANVKHINFSNSTRLDIQDTESQLQSLPSRCTLGLEVYILLISFNLTHIPMNLPHYPLGKRTALPHAKLGLMVSMKVLDSPPRRGDLPDVRLHHLARRRKEKTTPAVEGCMGPRH